MCGTRFVYVWQCSAVRRVLGALANCKCCLLLSEETPNGALVHNVRCNTQEQRETKRVEYQICAVARLVSRSQTISISQR